MYYTLERIYRSTHRQDLLQKAGDRGWITAEEMNKIISEAE